MNEDILKQSLVKIDDLLFKAKTDKSIDIKDLRIERKNCVIALKKLRNERKTTT